MSIQPVIETKYVFPRNRAKTLISWLSTRTRPDTNHPRGIVSSIYFDSRDWFFLGEKINSDFLKSKSRLRWYLDLDTKKALPESFFEFKCKVGLSRRKHRILTELSGEYLETVNLDDPSLARIANELFCRYPVTINERLFPAFVVSYCRHRFYDPLSQSRICVDYDITIPKVSHSVRACGSAVPLAQAIVEIKSSVIDLPHTLSFLNHLGCKKQSFSKYLAGYVHVTGTIL